MNKFQKYGTFLPEFSQRCSGIASKITESDLLAFLKISSKIYFWKDPQSRIFVRQDQLGIRDEAHHALFSDLSQFRVK